MKRERESKRVASKGKQTNKTNKSTISGKREECVCTRDKNKNTKKKTKTSNNKIQSVNVKA